MYFETTDITVLVTYQEIIGTIAMNNRIIKNVTLFEPARASDMPECYGLIGIMRGGTAFANIIASLGQGYLGNSVSLEWNGQFQTDTGCHLFASVYGHTAQVYRLCVSYEEHP